ncbi:MAG TPA: twin-arginine translocase subunit TatC [Verrucomicrobiales bacterium]|nr:twin-arginine translocase subunit TatC [Verrucomicrobiales bacterium]HBE96189.1 twin-arginine translocase subunit TatC [Verrucomicrobiales bacterium]|tara:strand:- start:29 stop:1414 length:1386 start_codon:yes stop_codon:yes gene_type:complete
MFFLKKMFQLRDQVNPDAEKPFLEHLEDLRIMITRITLTLLFTTIACFLYKDTLMNVIRKPIDEVWVTKQESLLPEELDLNLEKWEKALAYASVSPQLGAYDNKIQEDWWSTIDDSKQRTLTEATVLYRAAKELPEKERKGFLESLPDNKADARASALLLLETNPSASLNEKGNLRLMSSFKPTETFMLTMKLAFFAGIVIAFPFILYFILQFVLPGLKAEERKALWPALAIGFGLFLCGVLFAYFYVLPNVLTFFYDWGKEIGVSNDWRIGYYISFATTFVLIFGLAFELPVVVMTMVKLGILSHSTMRETRSYAILAIFVIAALITPTPDIMTLSLLAVPMCVLYEICIWLSYFHEKKVRREEEEEEKERMERLLSKPSEASLTEENEGGDHSGHEDYDHPDHDDYHHHEDHDSEDDYDHHDDEDHLNYPGERQNPDEDPNHDPHLPDEDIPDEEKDRD